MKNRSYCALILLTVMLCSQHLMAATNIKAMALNLQRTSVQTDKTPWDWRCSEIFYYIHKQHPQVIALQDVDSLALVDLAQGLPEYTISTENDYPGLQHKGKNVILYLKENLKLLDRGVIWLSDTPDMPSRSLETNTISTMIWGVFQEPKTGLSFILANTNFSGLNEEEQISASVQIKTYLSKMSNKTPILLTGDFYNDNTHPYFQTMITRFIPLVDIWTVSRKNVSSVVAPSVGVPSLTYFMQMFCSPNFRTKSTVLESIISKKGLLVTPTPVLYVYFTLK